MDGIREFLTAVRDAKLAVGNFRGLLHIAIGRTVTKPDGTIVSKGLTWRELASELKVLRYDTNLVRELGADPDELSARDRERFWYSAISLARVDSPEALAAAEKLVAPLKELGYLVGPAPAGIVPTSPPPVKPPVKPSKPAETQPREKTKDDKSRKKKK
jgi:hypothetical protein